MEEQKKPRPHTINSDMLTEDQEKLFWAKRTIAKFKEYDKKRTEYVRKLEHDYQALREQYDELEKEVFDDGEQNITPSKAQQHRKKMLNEYQKIKKGEVALAYMQKKYMVDGEYTEDFKKFIETYDKAMMKENLKTLSTKVKKFKKENKDLLDQLIKCRLELYKLQNPE